MRTVRTKQDFSLITKKDPKKSLTRHLPYQAGRSRGKISVRHKGGRVKRLYRAVDFKLERKLGVPAKVMTLEYDPYRSARIALIRYRDGEYSYILAPQGLRVNDEVITDRSRLPFKAGMRMPLEYIVSGTMVHNIQMNPQRDSGIVRSAGTSAQVLATQGKFVQVKLPSSEIRLFPKDSLASIGQVSNVQHGTIVWEKAGRVRKLGVRPSVRGVAMSPYAHPHGGGEGRTGEGRIPKTPWGKLARGVRTRRKHKQSNKFIVQRRKK